VVSKRARRRLGYTALAGALAAGASGIVACEDVLGLGDLKDRPGAGDASAVDASVDGGPSADGPDRPDGEAPDGATVHDGGVPEDGGQDGAIPQDAGQDGGTPLDGGQDAGCPPCNPLNVNFAGSACDLDCSGTTVPPAPCDHGLAVDGGAPELAKALGLCQTADATHWGLVSATYTRGYGSTALPAGGQHGILSGFGTNVAPREGANLAVLSSGYARVCDDPSATATCAGGSGQADPYFKGAQTAMYDDAGAAPPGYPKTPPGCPPQSGVYDAIGLTLKIKAPANAQSFSFDFDFYSSGFPEYVCSPYDDGFVAWLQSAAWAGKAGDLNLSFDTSGNPITVDTTLISECTPGVTIGCAGTKTATSLCSAGASNLVGTGFYDIGAYCTPSTVQSTGGAATGWLTTTAPVKGGETITLQLIIWDTGDPNWDSSVLVDHLQWYGTPAPTPTTAPSP
jgi:hypothetical protein